MRRWAPAILIAASASACSNTPARIESHALANPPLKSERFIIAAVDNDSAAFLGHAGSTPRGYDTITVYGPSSSALKVMRSLENDYGLREVSAWPIEPLHMHCAVLQLPDGSDRAAVLERLSHDPRIKLAQPLQNFATRTGPYNDPYVGLQRGFEQMQVADAHMWSRGEGIKIAIIDTGADTEHPDLAASIAGAENFVDSDTVQFRHDRHGTEIAGIIAAVANNREGIVGVAPASRLLILKACWQARVDADAAYCNSFTLARALVAALDAHAQVVNLSLAGPEDPLLDSLIREGLRRGVKFVGAASSDAPDKSLMHQPGVIEVASSESPSALTFAVYAPGREILTLLPGGHYDFASGESISTAQVTGVVALLLARDRALSAADIYKLLRDTSTRPGSTRTGAADTAVEHVDACAALIAVVGRGACKASDTDPRLAKKQALVERR